MTSKNKSFLRQLPYLLIPLAMLGLFLLSSLQDKEDPAAPARAFMAGIYEYYGTDNGPPELPEDTLTLLFSPELLALWQQGQGLSQQFGEPNATSYDPFCLCQEYYRLRVASITAQLTDDTHADATVRFVLSFQDDNVSPFTFNLGYKLIATDDGWRVDDILAPTAQDPSLRARIGSDILNAITGGPAGEQTPESPELQNAPDAPSQPASEPQTAD